MLVVTNRYLYRAIVYYLSTTNHFQLLTKRPLKLYNKNHHNIFIVFFKKTMQFIKEAESFLTVSEIILNTAFTLP